jgi:hypothetical protein
MALGELAFKYLRENQVSFEAVKYEARKSNPEGVEAPLAQDGAQRSPG